MRLFVFAFVAFVASVGSGHAQTPDEPTAQKKDADPAVVPKVFEEVIVTARRQKEKLLDVPASVTVISDRDLEASRITTVEQVSQRVPGLKLYEFNVGISEYFMRGIGSVNRSGAADPAVGVFLDDVYATRGSSALAQLFDVERIEILRGPQGTFFGRNTIGGAIAVHPRRPVWEESIDAALTLGTFGRADAEVVLNRPISEQLAARLAIVHRRYGGHSLNTDTSNHLDDENRTAVRASMLWKPTIGSEWLLSFDTTHDRHRGRWWHLAHEGPFSQGNANDDPRRGRNQIDGFGRRSDWGATLRFTRDNTPWLFTSITAARAHEYSALDNTTGLYVAPLTDPDRFRYHHTLFIQGHRQDAAQLSQDLRVARTTGKLHVLSGLYFLREDVERRPHTEYRFLAFNLEGSFGHLSSVTTTAIAAYANAEYDVTNRITAAIGLRWNRDEKSVRSTTVGSHFLRFRDRGVPVDGWTADNAARWSQYTPTASVSLHATSNTRAYALVAKGFKSGGFNDEAPDRISVITPFAPEIAWNYEIGLKHDGQHGQLAASLFHIDYTDMQVEQFVVSGQGLPPVELTTNAGAVVIRGLELEGRLRIGTNTELYGSYAYTHTRASRLLLGEVDITGHRLPYAPPHKIFVGANRPFATRLGELSARIECSVEDDFYADINNTSVSRLPGRTLVDAFVTWSPRDHVLFQLSGRNLLNEVYSVTATEVPVEDRYDKLGAPRTLMFTVAYRR
jgi:iron complex outermembrane recepter protein